MPYHKSSVHSNGYSTGKIIILQIVYPSDKKNYWFINLKIWYIVIWIVET